jgi:geranylgeranyl diphosphate synthase type II
VDDILDDIGDPVITGKPTCSDQKRGKHTYVDSCGIEECKQEVERLSNTAVDILNSEFTHQSEFLINLTYLLLRREK